MTFSNGSIQTIFNPVDFGFEWTTDGWYTFDATTAQKAARRARDVEAKRLRAEGRTVYPFSLAGQLISRGGIGSGRPHIEVVVNCYGLNAY